MISTPSGPHTTLEILILFEMYEYYVTRCENKGTSFKRDYLEVSRELRVH